MADRVKPSNRLLGGFLFFKKENVMSKKLRELQSKKATLVTSARAITDIGDKEARDLNAEEITQFDAISAQIAATNAAIDREHTLIAAEAQVGISAVLGNQVTENIENDPRRGFHSFGDFAKSVAQTKVKGTVDKRLSFNAAAPSTFGNEAAGADGGFAIPPQFSADIWRLSLGEDSLLPLTQNTEITGNSMIFPKDESTPWGTAGVQVYWQSEAGVPNQSKPIIGNDAMILQKLMALVPVTNEMIDDGFAIGSYLQNVAPERITYRTNEAILFGDGVGKPFGALNSLATIIQAKDAAQATGTVSATNISNMVTRLLVGQMKNAVWIGNPDILTALEAMTLGNFPIFLPTQNAAQGSFGMLKGRPLILSEHANAFSSQGDLNLVSLQGYRTITKAGGIQTATSMHLYFDADATAFKFTFRLNGKPILSKPVVPPKSANTRSHFITLAAR
jgi:HK97 family phage major capsid protein